MKKARRQKVRPGLVADRSPIDKEGSQRILPVLTSLRKIGMNVVHELGRKREHARSDPKLQPLFVVTTAWGAYGQDAFIDWDYRSEDNNSTRRKDFRLNPFWDKYDKGNKDG
jgi:hypothetical protein